MAIDARLLVLDEPTLGLDILYRKQFYDSLLNDYFDRSRTIVVTTHQVEEIQNVLTDRHVHQSRPHRLQLQHGRIRVALSGSDGASRAASPRRERSSRCTSARCSVAASCCSIGARSPATRRAWRRAHAQHRRLVRCRDGRYQAIRQARTRSGAMNTQSNAMPDSARLAGGRTRGHVGDPAPVLVGATRIVGEPFDLHRAAGRRRLSSCSASDQPDSLCRAHACAPSLDLGADAAARAVDRRSRTTSLRF